jgi:hypothetical protein
MISLLTTLMMTASNPANLGAPQSSNLIAESKVIDDYQFEVLVPDQIVLSKPVEKREFKIGLKITNNTDKPRWFLFGPLIPVITRFDGSSVELSQAIISINGISREDYQEIAPGQSKVYFGYIAEWNKDYKSSLYIGDSHNEGYLWGRVLAGMYKISLRYTNYNSSRRIGGENPELIDNIWVGDTYTPSKEIQIMKPKD